MTLPHIAQKQISNNPFYPLDECDALRYDDRMTSNPLIRSNRSNNPYLSMTTEQLDSLDDATIDAIELQLLESASSALTDDCD